MYKTHFLKGAIVPTETVKQHIEETVREVFEQVHKGLNLEECEILFTHNPKKIQEGELFGGFPCDSASCYVCFAGDALERETRDNPERVRKNLTEHLLNILYATARTKHINLETDCGLLEEIIGEGLAARFTVEMTASEPKPWHTQLSDTDIDRLWKEVRAECAEENTRTGKDRMERHRNIEKWFRGNSEENIPPLTALALGFATVETYLNRTGKNSVETITVPAENIIHGAADQNGAQPSPN